jgi:diguanylate cyclase (GGDEF)-like protein
MGERLEEVFSTASDLLSIEDLGELLDSIMRRAAGAVNAPRYLLVVRTALDEPIQLHHHGFSGPEAQVLAAELWKEHPDDAGGSHLIVDIASSRQSYGRLAAVYPPGLRFMAREREIFSLYANYAATALDLVTALAESRRSNATARALLDFSRALSRVGTSEEVSQTLADTVVAVVGCERASVLLWDPVEQSLVFKAVSGGAVDRGPPGPQVAEPNAEGVADYRSGEGAPEAEAEADVVSISPTDTSMVSHLMASRDIIVIDRTVNDPFLLSILERYGSAMNVMAPLFSDEEFLGVVSADFLHTPATDPRQDRNLTERLRALADQSVTAFQNAWLLEQVGHLAWHDALTGLPNRRLLEDRVDQELERAKRVKERSTMFFVDLDRYKKVNDTFGHAAGDELIRQVAWRLREVVRRQDTVARLGGDEFAILLPGLAELDAISQLAERMLDSLRAPYVIEGNEINTSASIGIATHPEHGESYDELLSHADEAMYRSKNLGRDTFQIFSEDLAAGVLEDTQLKSDLHHALARNELFVLYQPYIDLQTNQVVGVEALVRWRHPVKGIMEPASFLPQAEESNLIVEIDEFVIKAAARQARQWMDSGLGPLQVSVNISSRDLRHPGFALMVIAALADNGVPPERFEVEANEQVGVDETGVIRSTIDTLRAHGVRFAIDDVRSGALPIEQAAFPVSTLKIDHSFVQILGPNEELSTLAEGIIGMAEGLGLDCVAEGVETHHQSRILLQRGCTTAQGFFFSPPLLPGDVERMIQAYPVAEARPDAAPPDGAVPGADQPDGAVPGAAPPPAAAPTPEKGAGAGPENGLLDRPEPPAAQAPTRA